MMTIVKSGRFWTAAAFLAVNAAGWVWVRNSQSGEPVAPPDQPAEQADRQPAAKTNNLPVAGSATQAVPRQAAAPAPAPAFLVTGCDAYAPALADPYISLYFSLEVSVTNVQAHVRIEPEVKLSFTQEWGRRLNVSGSFELGKEYTVIVGKGVTSRDGTTLEAEVRRTVTFPERDPFVSIAADGRYLAPHGNLNIPVMSVNVTQIVTRVARVLPQNLVQLSMREADRYRGWFRRDPKTLGNELGDWFPEHTNAVRAARNKEARTMVALGDILKGAPQRGVYAVCVTADDVDYDDSPSMLVCVSDIGLSARRGEDEVVVWVTSLSEGAAKSGRAVQLYAPNGAELARGKSDAQGIVRLAVPKDKEPFLLAAQVDGDETFLVLNNRESSPTRPFLKPRECEAFVMTDRGIYRHGETLFVQTLLRDAEGRAPETFPLLLETVRGDGVVTASVPVTPDALGAATAEVPVPEFWRSGQYRVRARLPGDEGKVLGETRVSVESFVPPQIRVSLDGLPASVTNGAELAFSVKAEHLFGKPAATLASAAAVSLAPVPFAPKGWEDWMFGDAEKSVAPWRVDAGKATLDADGKGAFTVALGQKGLPAAALKATVEGSVTETGGRAVTARGSVEVHAYPCYIGIQTRGRHSVDSSRETTVRLVAVLPDGKPLKATPPLDVRLERVTWVTSMRKTANNRYQWVSERIKSEMTNATQIVDGSWTFRTGETGQFLLTATDPEGGASTSWEFSAWHEGHQEVAWSHEKPESVEIVFDKSEYRPGDVARAQIRAPFAGTAWLTLQRTSALEHQVVTLTNNTAEVSWTVGDWAPNAELAVAVVRPAVAEAVWRAHRAQGTAPLRVIPADRRLSVSVKKPADAWLPRKTLSVNVAVRDAAGQPAAGARVTLFAVDEGICMLTGHKVPDPAARFLSAREGGIVLDDVYRALMPIADERMWGEASHVGGDEDDELLKRLNPVAARRFKPLSLWRANVTLGDDGTAEIPLDVPEFAGELRLMAVAWNAVGTGCSEDAIKIRRNVVVQPDFPRVLAPGDEATAVVALHNESADADTATVTVSMTGGAPLAAQAAQQVTLAKGASLVLPIPLKAREEIGTGRVTVSVTGGDAIPYDETFELAVRPAQALRVTHESVALKKGAAQTFAAPEGLMPGTVKQRFTGASMPMVNLLGALEYVTYYPYGCLEQTVSGAFPFLPLAALAGAMPADKSTLAQEAPGRVRAALARVRSMKRENGYAMWPDAHPVAHYATVYTAHFIVEARRMGYTVPDGDIETALNALRNVPKEQEAYALCVLALAGRPDAGRMLRMFERVDELTQEERLLLARALARSGEPVNARKVMEKIPKVEGLREVAFGLMTGLELFDRDSPFIAACVREIERLRDRRGHWGTTQDNALALLALGAWQLAAPQEEDGAFNATFAWQGGDAQSGETNAFACVAAGALPVTVSNAGPGTLYVTRSLEGVPLEAPPAISAGIAVRREWLTLDGKPVTATNTLTRGDLLVVKLSVNVGQRTVDDLVLEDLLPACLEIECADLRKAGTLPWIVIPSTDWVLHQEARDDRMLVFGKAISGEQEFFYSARVVSAGRFTVPATVASRMYAPEFVARTEAGQVTVVE